MVQSSTRCNLFAKKDTYCGWTKSLHHFETMGIHCLLIFTGESSLQGFLGGAGFLSCAVCREIHHEVSNSHQRCCRPDSKRIPVPMPPLSLKALFHVPLVLRPNCGERIWLCSKGVVEGSCMDGHCCWFLLFLSVFLLKVESTNCLCKMRVT